ncbi:MAG: type II CRISPR-associated endonuclease Cas1 [Mucilaginibacter sp.]
MIKRTLLFNNPAYLSKRNEQLLIELPDTPLKLGEKENKRSVPMEDIGVVILDNQQITITQAALASLLQNNAAIITCNDTHHPVGLFLPLDGHDIQSERFRHQINATEPLKKQLWQQTVSAKILNQAALLAGRGIEVENMLHWAKSVRSGDPDNFEGRAAAYYWRYLFGSEVNFYRRREGEPPNNLLNYGYAILRAMVARGLVSSGLLPTLGIHHRNKYNAYCLADDIMEPYRPYVDAMVCEILDDGEDFEFITTELKSRLLGIATQDVQIEKESSPLMVGLQRTTASLAKCYEQKSRKVLYPLIPMPVKNIKS